MIRRISVGLAVALLACGEQSRLTGPMDGSAVPTPLFSVAVFGVTITASPLVATMPAVKALMISVKL